MLPPRVQSRLLRLLGIAALGCLLSACGLFSKAPPPPPPGAPAMPSVPMVPAPPPPGPTLVKATIVASPEVNPDARGRASPVVVKVYELRSLAAFNNAHFFDVFDKDKDSLGAELVGREEHTLAPASSRQIDKKPERDTKFLGVVVAFRDLERATWRASVPVEPEKINVITVHLDARRVSVVAQTTPSVQQR